MKAAAIGRVEAVSLLRDKGVDIDYVCTAVGISPHFQYRTGFGLLQLLLLGF
jgi:hypothetical protein